MNERSTDIVAAADLAVEMPPGTETGILRSAFEAPIRTKQPSRWVQRDLFADEPLDASLPLPDRKAALKRVA
ncbi:MAG: hypothetical protein F4W90_05285 [Gammaproteobacteria bacterium]|nr:hypothetical protein [Gammaproteobacteria bacterium]